jgi:hypothetical protein
VGGGGWGAGEQLFVQWKGSVRRGTEVSGHMGDSEHEGSVWASDVAYSAILKEHRSKGLAHLGLDIKSKRRQKEITGRK